MIEQVATWVVATSNPGKVREIEAILADAPIVLTSLASYPPVDFPEEGADYEENAIVKAVTAAEQTGAICVADDSGLEVDALNGRPGPLSARYGGEELDDDGRVSKLLDALQDVPDEKRGARFVCHAALATPEGDVVTAFGECRGRILRARVGDGGFGYDPVFQLEGRTDSVAAIPAELKNRLSHRAIAFRALWERWAGRPSA